MASLTPENGFIEVARMPRHPGLEPQIDADALINLRQRLGKSYDAQSQTTKFYFDSVAGYFNPAKSIGRVINSHPEYVLHRIGSSKDSDSDINLQVVLGEVMHAHSHSPNMLAHKYIKDSLHAAAALGLGSAALVMALTSGIDYLKTGDSLEILKDSGICLTAFFGLSGYFHSERSKRLTTMTEVALRTAERFPIVTMNQV